ncbi:MAG: YonK family protein [Bacillota bacterium]|nr:YonK family protein [Bacillota bacterium]
MAKDTRRISFNKAILSKNDNNEYMVEEITKDDSVTYNLSKELDKFVSQEGLTISIAQDGTIDPEE